MSIKYTKTLDKDKFINNNPIIKDFYKKCSECKNSIFKIYKSLNYDTVYAIGDIHGDYNTLLQILLNLKCIVIKNNNIKWNPIKKNTCIVQVGDIMDGYSPKKVGKTSFKSEDFKIINLLLKLDDEANKYKSKIILLYGNHDMYNLIRLLDDITKADYSYSVSDETLKNKKEYLQKLLKVKDKIMCKYLSVCIVNNYFFCHSGFVLSFVENLLNVYNININDFIELCIDDKLFLINICSISLINYLINNKNKNRLNNKQLINAVNKLYYNNEYEGIQYNIKDMSNSIQFKLISFTQQTNLLFNTNGMIVGHNTIQNYKINKIDNLYGIDVKLSEGFGEDKINEYFQILKIDKNKKPEIINIKNKFYK